MKRSRFASGTILTMAFMLLVLSQVQLFAQQGTWVAKAPMPTARMGLGTSVVNGVIYAVGGFNNGTYFAVVEAYDPANDTWTTKASMPTARRLLSTSVVNGVIYAVGGQSDNGSYLGTVEAYDPASNTWATKASMPTPRHQLSTSAVNGVIYAMGGSNGVPLGTVEAYDPASDTWITKASMPTARFGAGTSAVDGLIYVIGGTTTGGSGFLGTVEAYDPSSDTWATRASMPTARQNLSATVVNGVFYGMGGYNGSFLGTVEAYDPVSDTWTTKAAMPTPRYELSTSAMNGVIYAIGGAFTLGTFGQLATVEAFTPPLPPLVGDGSAITNLTAANISSGTAGINITGNAATATSASGLICTGCVGNTQLGINYAGSTSKAGPATSALSANVANQATNSLSLGGILATDFARLDIGNAFTGSQNVAGNLAVIGTTALGSGGTPILKHMSSTFTPAFPALKAQACSSANFTFTGVSDGDTIALGVPTSRMTGGGTMNYFAWVGAANTITIRACNSDASAKQTMAGSGSIRVDVWKH